ncbi:MAG: cytochrome c1 [Burkholderiales bacterium]|nr:cytochrome c1 [Burkholderiales bacterium]
MKKTFLTVVAALLVGTGTFAIASGGADLRLAPAPAHRLDAESLQRGARNFVNYCLNCHSAQFMRFERLQDIGLTEDQIKDNLMFGADKIGATMTVAMTPAEAAKWFGVAPPDLSVISRVRGTDWLYNYMLGFYADSKSTTGWNNLVFPSVAMPHVLWELSGPNRLVEQEFDDHGKAAAAAIAVKGLVRLASAPGGKWIVQQVDTDPNAPGTMQPAEYRAFAADLVNFLDFVGEPTKNKRISLGIIVLMYFVVLFALVYALKRMYWKDVPH